MAAPYTQLSPVALPGRRYGSFAGKTVIIIIGGPFTIDAQDSYNAGAVTHDSYSAGIEIADSYNAGAHKQEGAS